MMISPEAYLEQMKDATYEQLIKERDGLIRYVYNGPKNLDQNFIF